MRTVRLTVPVLHSYSILVDWWWLVVVVFLYTFWLVAGGLVAGGWWLVEGEKLIVRALLAFFCGEKKCRVWLAH